ncbi:uncharacterized protein CFAP97D2 [Phalacrocorax aristotelis]|uniref:uncharacterized protein CFAP97D2 n=1 Tax=Phalacrocorax aristotelis TaxID=126867 RepID=UPI003F4B3595
MVVVVLPPPRLALSGARAPPPRIRRAGKEEDEEEDEAGELLRRDVKESKRTDRNALRPGSRKRGRIQAAKPLVDTSTPAIYSHLHVKLEKLKLQEDRLSIIERDNCLLLEMSSCIMRTKGRIDNKNYYKAKR